MRVKCHGDKEYNKWSYNILKTLKKEN